jgi:GPI mannosyltransferase 2
MLSDCDRRVLTVAALSRLVTCSLAAALSWLVVDYDSSAEYLPPSPQRQPLTWLVWDTVYFDRIATDGYEYEQYHAFFPLLPGEKSSTLPPAHC